MPDAEDLSSAGLGPATSGARSSSNLISTLEASRLLRRNVRSVRRAIERGELRAIKVGSAYRVAVEELMRYAAHTSTHPPARAQLVALPALAPGSPSLPEPLSSFVGRDDEIAAALSLLASPAVRVLTMTGPGGIGKTRLSLAVAAAMRGRFPDGVAFAGLAPLSQPGQVMPAIVQALGLRETAGSDRRAKLRAFLAEKRLLLVLDNVEHLLEAAPGIAELLRESRSLKVLATGRAPMRIAGEHEFPLAPLSLPEATSTPVDLLASDATRLFIERVQARDPTFTVNAATAPVIAEICARLDGLPLAIELAAARAPMLSPQAMRDRMERRLPLLTTGHRDAPHRHRTMRDAIAWSYELLTPEEQALFRRLAVFVGGCTLDAAAEVAFGVGSVPRAEPGTNSHPDARGTTITAAEQFNFPAVLDLMSSLREQNLLAREIGPTSEPRFRMLETVREFGTEKLESEQDAAFAAHAAHAQHFLRFARAMRPYSTIAASRTHLNLMAADDANLRGALTWFDEHGQAAEVVGLVVACWRYWQTNGMLNDASHWLARATALREDASPPDRARLAIAAAELLMIKGASADANQAFDVGIPLTRATGDLFDLASALLSHGASLKYDGKYVEAESQFAEAFKLAHQIAPPDLQMAVAGRALGNLGTVARARGNLDLAKFYGEASLRHYQDPAFDLAETSALGDLAELARDQGNLHLAVERYLAVIERMGEEYEARILADVLLGLAHVAAAWGQHRKSVLLFSAEATLRERVGFAMVVPADAATAEETLAVLRRTLGEAEFSSSWAEGRGLPIAEVAALAATLAPATGLPATTSPVRPVALTHREQDVLRLLAVGQTDRQIAEALFIGARTVSWHVSAILGKLNARTRREAVEQARAVGLV
ncbi:MAG: LuxR C-terminal-related transcriptional regulator [Thermomicrobiales bacterium]